MDQSKVRITNFEHEKASLGWVPGDESGALTKVSEPWSAQVTQPKEAALGAWHHPGIPTIPRTPNLLQSPPNIQGASPMPTPPPVRKPRPGAQAAPPKPIQAPSPAPVLSVPPEAVEPVQAPPEPKKLKIRTRYGYPIYVPHLDRRILPEETAEVLEHEWIRKQIQYGIFIEV